MRYTTSLEHLTPDMLQGFFVDWPNPPSAEAHLKLLQQSYKVVLAIDDEAKQAAGFITAISDGVLSAYIPLLEVLPSYQNKGIGGQLVRTMLEELQGLYMIDLMCDQHLQEYYKKLGMFPATGMIVRNYNAQSGKSC
ncbi:MAG: GNAT family N-acetyltransferase [Paenibacillus sp.]|uniref:Acetyltransferase (GNAT) family protein n=1 Tax=Paenibacillus aquistagni TaxID=1852522 RepID=A0A1X7I9G5_9BACL|nr:GNAT family N-acetyltransferase [Paenibacillus aquistagni]MBR2569506.1 GNAT family N-acetyltransferase [Paenibacillus sp.]SMG10655.1 Acetyltransferase (GNAT) family protein [Paenibacillus aquistagni]